MCNDYYVYIYLDPRKPGSFTYKDLSFDYEPFYVGEGREDRDTQHLRDLFTKRQGNRIKANKLKHIFAEGLQPVISRVTENLSQQEAYELEKQVIRNIGRLCESTGPLANFQEGGTGGSQPNEIRKQTGLKISQRWKEGAYKNKIETPMSDEQKEKLRLAHLGKKQTAEQVAKRVEARAGYQHSEETKQNIRAGQNSALHAEQSRQNWLDPEIRKKRSEGIARAWSERKTLISNPRIWIHKEGKSMCCEKIKAAQFLQEGWIKGRGKLKE